MRITQPHRDQHDVQELLVPPAVDDNVDGGVDDQSKVVDVDKCLDPVRPIPKLSVEKELKINLAIIKLWGGVGTSKVAKNGALKSGYGTLSLAAVVFLNSFLLFTASTLGSIPKILMII